MERRFSFEENEDDQSRMSYISQHDQQQHNSLTTDSYNPFRDSSTSYASSSVQAPLPQVPPLLQSTAPVYHSQTYPSYGRETSPSPFQNPFDNPYHSTNVSRQNVNELPKNNDSPDFSYEPAYATPASQYPAHDPFTDRNAILLEEQPNRDNSYKGYNTSPLDHGKPLPSPVDSEHNRGEKKFGRSRTEPKFGVGYWRGKKMPFAVYTLSLIQLIVFIVEIVKNAQLTGSAIETKPTFNYMIGPSPWVVINMGARYVPCMRAFPLGTNTSETLASSNVLMPCPNTTTGAATCTLSQLCGFGLNLTPVNGQEPEPHQWWRFIVPIFLHGGILHIGFNLLLQLTLGKDIERIIGTLRFVLVYFASGIFGFIFGGNFAPNGLASTGCSGALFGLLAINLLHLIYTWREKKHPRTELVWLGADIILSFVIGLLPLSLDNFSHIGGFLTGLILGIVLLHSPEALRTRIGLDDPPYSSVDDHVSSRASQTFFKQPIGFFKGRKPLWWAWWLVRAGALVLFLVAFIVLLKNFFIYHNTCTWCKYLSCLPVKNWCDVGNLTFTNVTTTPPARKFRF